MAIKEFVSGYFHDTDDQEEEVTIWRERYDRLIGRLGVFGSEVNVRRVLERDQDNAPYRFMRGAAHEFIFPRQQVSLTEDRSGVIDPSPWYKIIKEDKIFDYDSDKVRGHLRVSYEDSDSRVVFLVEDALSQSELPARVLELLDEVFLVPEQVA